MISSERFNLMWETAHLGNFNIVVGDEYRDPRSGTTILVEVNTQLVYQARLKSKPDDNEAMTNDAVEATRTYISNLRGQYESKSQEE